MSHDGLNWRAACRVNKFSIDQVNWINNKGFLDPKFRDFKRFNMTPEDGVLDVPGNIAVTSGLTNVTALMTATGGTAFSGTQGICGVGSVSTPAQVSDVVLGGNGSSSTAWYQILDSAPTVSAGLIEAVCTFGGSVANFGWNEWCWAAGTSPITAGNTLSTVGGGSVMLNHKVTSLGTKISGASWSLETSVTLS